MSDPFPFVTTYQVDDPGHVEWHNDAGSVLNQAVLTSGATMQTNAGIEFPTYTPTSGISRLVKFTMGHEYDRPWVSWLDEFARHRVALGYHSRDYASGNYHNAFEIKISTSPLAANPADMRTRFSLSTDVEIGMASFPSTDRVQVDRSIYSADTSFGFLLRMPDSGGTSRQLATFQTSITSAGDTATYLESFPAGPSNSATLNVFRQTNSTVVGGVRLHIKRGNNTPTDAFVFDASRGWLNVTEAVSAPSTNASSGGYLFVSGGALKFRGGSGTVTTIAAA